MQKFGQLEFDDRKTDDTCGKHETSHERRTSSSDRTPRHEANNNIGEMSPLPRVPHVFAMHGRLPALFPNPAIRLPTNMRYLADALGIRSGSGSPARP